MESVGAGLGGVAFSMFIASIIVAGVWDGVKEREAQHETLRCMTESGKPVDEASMRKLMIGERKRPDRDLKIAPSSRSRWRWALPSLPSSPARSGRFSLCSAPPRSRGVSVLTSPEVDEHGPRADGAAVSRGRGGALRRNRGLQRAEQRGGGAAGRGRAPALLPLAETVTGAWLL